MGSEAQLEVRDAPPGRRSVPFVLWVLIALAFTLVEVRQSLHGGRLSAPPTYDDVAYFLDAQTRLGTFYDEGPVEFIRDLFRRPPHSPWSTCLALLSFLVFGIEDWAPAATGGLIILGILLWLSCRARRLSLPWQLLIAGFLLTWPLAGQAVVNFRPDIACGLAVAWTALHIVRRPWLGASGRRHCLAGAGLALALLIKPTFSPVAVSIVLAALVAASLTDIVGGHPWRRWQPVAISWSRCLGLGALLAGPYYAFAFPGLASYIYLHNFGELQEVWKLELAPSEHLLFYLTGVGGRFLLDAWLYLWIVLAVAALGLALARRDYGALVRLPAAAAVLALTLASISIPSHKNEFLGAVLPCLLFLTALEMMIFVAGPSPGGSVLSRSARRLVPISLFIVGGVLFRWPPHFTELGRFLPQHEVRQHEELLDGVYRDILRSGEGPARVLFTHIGPYLNPPLLQYRFGIDRLREVVCVDRAMTDVPADLENQLAVASEVIAFSPDNRNAMRWLPVESIQRQVLDRLREDPRFFLDAAYASPGGGQVFLFSQVLGFRGFRPIEGLEPIEGPYPQLGLPSRVRWGLSPRSRLEIEVPHAGGVRLVIEGLSNLPDQTMTVEVAGRVVAEHRFQSQYVFERIELTEELPPGIHLVELRYSQSHRPDENENRPLAVMFRTLKVLEQRDG